MVCDKEDGAPVGICRNPSGCNPEGNVCHFKDYVCRGSSSRDACCAAPGNSGVCRLDLLKVEIDGTFVPKGPNGWQLDLTGNPWAVVLQGATCTKVETEGAQAVRIVYGCPTVQ